MTLHLDSSCCHVSKTIQASDAGKSSVGQKDKAELLSVSRGLDMLYDLLGEFEQEVSQAMLEDT